MNCPLCSKELIPHKDGGLMCGYSDNMHFGLFENDHNPWGALVKAEINDYNFYVHVNNIEFESFEWYNKRRQRVSNFILWTPEHVYPYYYSKNKDSPESLVKLFYVLLENLVLA